MMEPEQADAERFASRIEQELRKAGRPGRAVQERRYLKSDLEFLGAGVPVIRRVARAAHRERGGLDRDALLAVADALWQRGIHECRMAAVELLDVESARLTAADLPRLRRLLHEARTWALVDGLAVSVVGAMLQRDAAVADALDRWVADEDFWVRRTALLALLPGVRGGEPDRERIARYAEDLLDESEFFIRKAIGWVLREVGKRDPRWVARWLGPRIGRASGVTVREAVKHLPEADRERLLAAYRDARTPPGKAAASRASASAPSSSPKSRSAMS